MIRLWRFYIKYLLGVKKIDAGKYAQYRFFAYVSSMYHKCEILINEPIPGATGKNHRIPVAVKNNGMYIAVAHNKATGNSSKQKRDDKIL